LLGHTNIRQTQHYFKRLRILRNLFKVKQSKKRNRSEHKIKMGIKKVHGQFSHSLEEELVDKKQCYRWLKFGDIKGETGIIVVAAQDQALSTACFKKKNSERGNWK
jgi:hypothetical protein